MVKVVDERGNIYWVPQEALRPVPIQPEIPTDSAILDISRRVLSMAGKGKPKYKPAKYEPPKYKPPKKKPAKKKVPKKK